MRASSRLISSRLAGSQLALLLALVGSESRTRPAAAQIPFEGEVRQIVTFSFAPGRAADAIEVFERSALPLYRQDLSMRSFRGFREVESSIPLDLVVVSSFDGMSGMDASNAELGRLGIGSFYSAVGPLIQRHHDQFVEMLPTLGDGDPSEASRTALVWYRVVPGEEGAFEEALGNTVVPWERARGTPSATGRFLLADGWHYLRIIGLESLGAYQAYWTDLRGRSGYAELARTVLARRDVLLARVPGLSVR